MKTVSEIFGRIPPLFLDLSKILAGEIDCSLETLQKYSSDGSLYTVTPQAVVYPKNVTDIKHVISFAREYAMPVTVRGGGTGKQGGALGEGIIIDMSRYFNTIKHISMANNVVTVDAGVTVSMLAERLEGWGYEIPPLLHSEKTTTIGGVFATRSISPSTFFHGSIREWVEGVSVVVDNGEEHKIADGITPSGRLLGIYQSIFPILSTNNAQIRAVKPFSNEDATGYSIWNTSIGPRQLIDQLSGSEGTLGIITSITFRVIPKRPFTEITLIPLKEDDIASVISAAQQHKADSLFMYDEIFQSFIERYHPGVLPLFIDYPFVLVVMHKDYDKKRLRDTVLSFQNDLSIEDYHIKHSENERAFSRILNYDFLHATLDMYSKGSLVVPSATEGAILRLRDIQHYIKDVIDLTSSTGKVVTITGYVGSGHVAVTALLDPYSKNFSEEVASFEGSILSLIKKYKGGISGRGGDGLTRTPYLSYNYNETTLRLFETIKKAWDPLLLLNPGKKINVTLGYLHQHLFVPKREQGKP